MKSPLIRFFLAAMLLLLLGIVACRKHAQDVCLDKSTGDACEIDYGCNADPRFVAGTCQPTGENNIMTCHPN